MAELTVEQQIDQLNSAKQLVSQDASFYPQIIKGILPIAQKPESALRLWSASFLAEGFSSTSVDQLEKEQLALSCLDTIEILVNDDDLQVQKRSIPCAALVYPLIYSYVCTHKTADDVWNKMLAIKLRVIELWDKGHVGLSLACIKFVQRIVAAQTAGAKDPRLVDASDASLTSVPLNHPLLHLNSLEAEGQGYLDRLLDVFYDHAINESILSATLYALGVLLKTRSTTVNKILTRILSFDPLSADYATTNPAKLKLELRCIEKNLRILLGNMMKTPAISSQYGPRIHLYLNQLMQFKNLSPEEITRKRSADSTIDSPSKRPRTDSHSPPTETGVKSYASLYTLIDTKIPSRNFDVKALPLDVLAEIALAGMTANSPQVVDAAVKAVQTRYSKLYPPPNIIKIEDDGSLEKSIEQAAAPSTAAVIDPPYMDDDDDDYEPDEYEPPDPIKSASPTPVPASQPASAPPAPAIKYEEEEDDDDYNPEALIDQFQPVVASKPPNPQQDDAYINEFREDSPEMDALALAAREQMTDEERIATFQDCIERLFLAGEDIERTIFEDNEAKKNAKDLADLNSVGLRGDIWVVLLARLGTRGIPAVQTEGMSESQIEQLSDTMARHIREKLYEYVIANFRERVEVAIMWLSEEWYNDKMKLKQQQQQQQQKCETKAEDEDTKPVGTDGTLTAENSAYIIWTMKIMDSVIPFLDVKDKVFLRFLSDLPELTRDMLYKLRILLNDPDRQKLGRFALQYLGKLRPPVREYCSQLLESFEGNEVKPAA
ncbi:hypothetical protein BZA70DRAFT_278821 [Myxozyma melibiosi]|uniref:Symplekin/Pta1 N-terminal domain-containing protein n=1 Tax=Myxozyma melibiosi TaxID=54550 RepID=A0ABR1F582_9ASCO